MKRIKLTVAYDGTTFSGWQIQKNAPTIELALDQAIEKLTGEKIHVIGASRTDAGVHALGNVAVFDTESTIPAERFAYALNRWLPDTIQIQESEEVPPDFHPRHCDTRKTYEYTICNSTFSSPQMRNYAWHVQGKLDLERMRQAASYLVGRHDFKSFCCVRTQAGSTIRIIYSLQILEEPMDEKVPEKGRKLIIRVTGNGFLYNMVRIIAGTLVQVGKGQIRPEQLLQMLESRDRQAAGQTAPPQGLCLMEIEYL